MHSWAYIDIVNVRKALRWCDANREQLPLLGEQAKDVMYEKFTREKVAVTVQNRLEQIIDMIEEKGIDYYRKKADNYIKIHDLEQNQEKIDAILARIQTVNNIDTSLTGVLKSMGRLHERVDRIEKLAHEVYQRSLQSDDSDGEMQGKFPDEKEDRPNPILNKESFEFESTKSKSSELTDNNEIEDVIAIKDGRALKDDTGINDNLIRLDSHKKFLKNLKSEEVENTKELDERVKATMLTV